MDQPDYPEALHLLGVVALLGSLLLMLFVLYFFFPCFALQSDLNDLAVHTPITGASIFGGVGMGVLIVFLAVILGAIILAGAGEPATFAADPEPLGAPEPLAAVVLVGAAVLVVGAVDATG